MATNNAVNTSLSGQTGTGNFVGANTPTLITPVIGVATGTSLNFGASTTNGLIGITGATSAASGVVGEIISSAVVDSAVSLSNGIEANMTSISLTAGAWMVSGYIVFVGNTGTIATISVAAINTVSATLPSTASPTIAGPTSRIDGTTSAGGRQVLDISNAFINISSTTTVYLVARCNFSVSTLTAGGVIMAHRIK